MYVCIQYVCFRVRCVRVCASPRATCTRIVLLYGECDAWQSGGQRSPKCWCIFIGLDLDRGRVSQSSNKLILSLARSRYLVVMCWVDVQSAVATSACSRVDVATYSCSYCKRKQRSRNGQSIPASPGPICQDRSIELRLGLNRHPTLHSR
jgi:hypothetical protein